ncbi:MAG: cob(I)yrinic acid a,c-diamide adenosyltransferase, partial [Heliobacteriaceae bacterium]|nr:cob(I)yrinic acid a,c-diamide adenosyltransferase [Heliobacteriaceae bacterium]
MARTRLVKGLVQVYTGNCKGKTTAALGLALRAVGHGYKVFIVQFMKGVSYYGELFSLQRFYPDIQLARYGRSCPNDSLIRQGEMECTGCMTCFMRKGEATAQDKQVAALALQRARQVISSGEWDIVILDELTNAIYFEVVTV